MLLSEVLLIVLVDILLESDLVSRFGPKRFDYIMPEGVAIVVSGLT